MKTKKIFAVLLLTGLIAIAAGTVSAAAPALSLAEQWNALRAEQPKLQIRMLRARWVPPKRSCWQQASAKPWCGYRMPITP